MDPRPPPEDVVDRLTAIAGALPETRQEDAWRGVRWRVRSSTFAHVLQVLADRPSSYADATGLDDAPLTLVFHADGDDLAFLSAAGLPFYKPPWSRTVLGLVIEHPDFPTDWTEVAELVTDSYRLRAPRKLARLLDA